MIGSTSSNSNTTRNYSNGQNMGSTNGYNPRNNGYNPRNNGYNPRNNNRWQNNTVNIEKQISEMSITFKCIQPSFKKEHTLFDMEELMEKKRQLELEFNHFTFHRNKKYYKHMDPMIDYVEPDPLVQAFSKLHPFPKSLSVDVSRYEYIKPCSIIQMKHLRLFNRPSGSLPDKYKSAFRRAVQHVSELIRLPRKLEMPTKESLENVRYDGTKFPGMDYARLKLRSRAEAHSIALEDAKTSWDTLMSGRPVLPHDTRLGGKGKLVKKGVNGKVESDDEISMGRLILMLSHRDLLILGALEQPLTDAYLGEEWPIYIGQSWYYGGSEKFVNKMTRHEVYHCFDAKKFDAAIDGWLVKEAIKILRDQYEGGMGLEYDTLWNFVYESLVEVIICRDDGIRMQKRVGTTSGNCFNTLVQSIITLFLGYTALIVRAGERLGEIGIHSVLTQCEVEALGDDMVMALQKDWSYLTKESLAEVVRDCFNIDWSGKKSFSTQRLMDDSDIHDDDKFKGVQFLGMYFRHQRFGTNQYAPKVVIPYRPFHESYLSLLFPKYGDYTVEHSWMRALGIYYNASGNTDTHEWLSAYFDFLELTPFIRPDVWPQSMAKMITKDFWNIGSKPPPPERITFQEWIQFACFPRNPDDD